MKLKEKKSVVLEGILSVYLMYVIIKQLLVNQGTYLYQPQLVLTYQTNLSRTLGYWFWTFGPLVQLLGGCCQYLEFNPIP